MHKSMVEKANGKHKTKNSFHSDVRNVHQVANSANLPLEEQIGNTAKVIHNYT